jgi:hypothetical protein
MLGEEISCVVPNLESAVSGGYTEDVFRKGFTVSERRANDEAIERQLAGRHGGYRGASAAIAALEQVEKGWAVDIAAL